MSAKKVKNRVTKVVNSTVYGRLASHPTDVTREPKARRTMVMVTGPTWEVDAILHLPLLVRHPSEPWSRVECKCGHRGTWLKNDWQCLPCPRMSADEKIYFVISVAGWGTLYGFGTVAEAETWRAHKANWERAVARKRLATAEEIGKNEFEDLSRL